MGKRTYLLKIDEATRKQLVSKQIKMSNVIKRITGKEKKPTFTKIAKICIANPIYLNDFELVKVNKKNNKIL